MSTENNIPAFPLQFDPFMDHPTHGRIHRNDIGEEIQTGMTILDYFAAKAMQANISIFSTEDIWDKETVAVNSYAMARYMLEERNKHII